MSTLVVYFLMLVCVVFLTLRRPAYALCLMLCNYGLQQWTQSQSAFFIQHATLTNLGTAGTIALAVVLKLLKGQPTFRNYPAAGWAALSLFTWSLVSWTWSVYPDGSAEAWGLSWRTVLVFIAVAPLLISDMEDLRAALLGTLAVGSVALVLILFTASWRGRSIVWAMPVWVNGKRVDMGNPLAIASMAAYVALAGTLLNFRGLGRFWQIVRWGVVAIAMAVLIQSSARGQVFALLFALIVFLPISRRIKNIQGFIATSVGLVLMVGLAWWAYNTFGDVKRFSSEAMFRDYRYARIGTALILLGEWLGSSPLRWFIGLGTSASYDPNILGAYPHFVALEVLGELGLIGFALFSMVLIYAARSIVRIYRLVREDPVSRGVLAAIAALFVLECILSCKQGSMIGSTFMFAFSIMLGRWEKNLAPEPIAAEDEPLFDDGYDERIMTPELTA